MIFRKGICITIVGQLCRIGQAYFKPHSSTWSNPFYKLFHPGPDLILRVDYHIFVRNGVTGILRFRGLDVFSINSINKQI